MLSKPAQMLLPLALLLLLLTIAPAHLLAEPLPFVHLTTAPQLSTGHAPGSAQPTRGAVARGLSPLAGHAAFVVEIYPDEYMRYIPNTATPDEWLDVGSVADTMYFAGDFVGGDWHQVYVIDFGLNELHALDTRTGAATPIGACQPMPGQVWTGATGTADGTLYASSTDEISSYLYTVDITTGAATVVGQITDAPAIIDIAINADGQMYGLDISSDSLVQINPVTGAGTVIGAIGFDADYAQGMDFEPGSGTLYLAAYNATASRGELRTADTSTGQSTLVGAFPDGAEADALAFTPPPSQLLQNPGLEDGWAYWQADGSPFLSDNSHSGAWSVTLSGQECWMWQPVFIPADALEVSISYWLTGISSDPDWDNDILCGSIWDLALQTEYVDVCYGLTYFYSYPMVWKRRIHRLKADELAEVAGKPVVVAFRLTQDWNPGYHKTSTAYVDDAALYVTRPIYEHVLYLALVVK